MNERTALDERLAQALARALVAAVRADEAEDRNVKASEMTGADAAGSADTRPAAV